MTSLFAYGYFANVRLSVDEMAKLKERFGEIGADDRIETLSLAKRQHGYKYKSDFAAILAWARKDAKKNGNGGTAMELSVEDQAQAIQREQQRALHRWQQEMRLHRHGPLGGCLHGMNCRFTEAKRPIVRSIAEIVKTLEGKR